MVHNVRCYRNYIPLYRAISCIGHTHFMLNKSVKTEENSVRNCQGSKWCHSSHACRKSHRREMDVLPITELWKGLANKHVPECPCCRPMAPHSRVWISLTRTTKNLIKPLHHYNLTLLKWYLLHHSLNSVLTEAAPVHKQKGCWAPLLSLQYPIFSLDNFLASLSLLGFPTIKSF